MEKCVRWRIQADWTNEEKKEIKVGAGSRLEHEHMFPAEGSGVTCEIYIAEHCGTDKNVCLMQVFIILLRSEYL